MSDDQLKAHEQFCPCYGGKCECICRGYSGAIDEIEAKLKIAIEALEAIKKSKVGYFAKNYPNLDPMQYSTTYRTAVNALSQIKDSIY